MKLTDSRKTQRYSPNDQVQADEEPQRAFEEGFSGCLGIVTVLICAAARFGDPAARK